MRLAGGFTLATISVPWEVIGGGRSGKDGGKIDRLKVVRRHNPRFTRFHPFHTLSVGNGRFAFNVDITGLQTFWKECQKEFPLCTVAHWGWHTTPMPDHLLGCSLRYKEYDAGGRKVGYATDPSGQEELFAWYRQNPHKFNLGRIGFRLRLPEGRDATPDDLDGCEQELDLWTGVIRSRFYFLGKSVEVMTVCAPDTDCVGIRVKSELLGSDVFGLVLAFPYGAPEAEMGRWDKPELHRTECKRLGPARYEFVRVMDDVQYSVVVFWNGRGELERLGPHEFVLVPGRQNRIDVVCAFVPMEERIRSIPASVNEIVSESTNFWREYWTSGGFVDFDGSTDPRAEELERRTILSLYQTAVHCAGPLPSQETGLLYNSWYGKFHLEMHWWHSVHFVTWDRFPFFERSLGIYHRILPLAREMARRQGYLGCRWPKMIGPDGLDSPSAVGPLLIWQQPHPIYYAELCYRRFPTRETLEKWKEIVFETANFMASFVIYDSRKDRYMIGPPIKTVSENNDPLNTWNPTFELTYWRFGLKLAQRWRERLGLDPHPFWGRVIAKLATPSIAEGKYLMQEGLVDTYSRWNWEHPALVGAFGMLPGDGIDPAVMRDSVLEVMRVWQWEKCWGWDFPLVAMAAARCGLPEQAVDALLLPVVKNRYLPNGHNYQRPGLTAYLPGNGGLLAAIGMMAGGWEGGPTQEAPGFPKNGKWKVTAEGLVKWL